ncbi:MAG: sulfatase-like hydrolase/transferase [Rhodospirillales bacterium]
MKQSSGSEPAAPRPRYDGGWRIAVVYFGLVSFGLAQPLFNITLLFRREFHLGLFDAVLIVFVFQYLTAAALAGVRRLLRAPYARLGFDFLIIAAAALMLIRQAQMIYLKTGAFSGGEKLIMLGGMIIGAVIAAVIIRRFLTAAVFYAGLVAPVFGAFFIYAMMNHPLPLERSRVEASVRGEGPAVILLALDELSADLLRGPGGGTDAGEFPNFARLAARSVQWRSAMANYPTSAFSFPSFLTSRLPAPDVNAAVNLENLPAGNLPDIFKNAGYSVHIYSDYFGCAGRRFDCTSYLDARRPNFLLSVFIKFAEEFGPDFMVDRFLPAFHARRLRTQHAHLTETVQTAQPGRFYFVHLLTPHEPYIFGAAGDYLFSPHLRMRPGADFTAALANYRAQVRYTDTVIGEMLDAMDARPAEAPLVLMLVSDHGNCWTDDCPGRAAPEAIKVIEPSLVNIPAMLLSPFHEPRVDEDDFQLIDVAPTLCEAAGLKGCGDYEFDGVSRLNGPPPPRPRQFILSPHHDPADIPLPARPVPSPPPSEAD